jgi:hypothetical protein
VANLKIGRGGQQLTEGRGARDMHKEQSLIGDPFASCPDLVQQARDFIIKRCIECCEKYPWWDFPSVLACAIELSCNAARMFRSELGSFEIFLGYHLRGLISIAEQETEDDQFGGFTRAQHERSQVRLGSNIYEWDELSALASQQRWWDGASISRKRRRMRKPIFPDGDGTRVVFYSGGGFTAFRLGFRINHDDLPAILLRGLMPDAGPIDVYRHDKKPNPKVSARIRRITKGWGLNGRAAHMDSALVQAAQEIEPQLTTEQDWAVFNWMMSEDRRSQTKLADALGLTKGGLSKARRRIAEMFRVWCAEHYK